MSNILITGSDGFISKNLIQRLKDTDHLLFLYSKKNTFGFLDNALLKSDIIYHFAGVNKSNHKEDFKKVNVELTQYIINFIEKNNLNVRIIFSSSIQADLNNVYGLSKLKAEELLIKYANKTNNQVFIYRLNGIFGKWSKPDYNSVVSTFCYRIINSLPIKIEGPNKKLTLTYIDDLVDDFMKDIISKTNKKVSYVKPSKKYVITVKKIYETIHGFDLARKDFMSENVGSGIKRKLYATYLSYLTKESYTYDLFEHKDKRGKFVEILKLKNNGQLSFITIKPNQSRGNHFHHTKSEKFIVLKGDVKFNFVNIMTEEEVCFTLSDKRSQVIESIPGWNHELINESPNEAIVVIWANEIYNPKKHDTYQKT
jgi:UDP-2-acetamido-2,6-beta-L-arabino-hexul-4-ose reductase